jgi:peptidylprolyl isomerase
MTQAKMGDRVKLHFVGKLDDGTIFESSEECLDDGCGCDDHADSDCGCGPQPLEFTIGDGDVFAAIEQAVIGMAPGEKRTVRLSAEEAFGERDEELIFEMSREELPEGLEPEEGEVLELGGESEEEEGFPVWVAQITDDTIVFDGNHPLAGNALNFDLELVEITGQ